MESKTLSKADTLKGLMGLRENQFFQFVCQASEVEVQQLLATLLHPEFCVQKDASTEAVSVLGTMRGLRWPKQCLDHAIARLTEEVKQEQNPQEPVQQKDEI